MRVLERFGKVLESFWGGFGGTYVRLVLVYFSAYFDVRVSLYQYQFVFILVSVYVYLSVSLYCWYRLFVLQNNVKSSLYSCVLQK